LTTNLRIQAAVRDAHLREERARRHVGHVHVDVGEHVREVRKVVHQHLHALEDAHVVHAQ